MSKFDDFIEPLIEREGGEKIVVDTGGTTKYGISEHGTDMSADDIKALTKRKAIDIYRDQYYKPSKCDKLPDHLQEAFFDCVVNQGRSRATKILQKAANHKNGKGKSISVDGRIGPNTIKAVQNVEVERFRAFRLMHYASIVLKRPDKYEKYYYGWYRRCNSV
ncbi:MAG: putative glycosyl hydrolase [Prokaryotic dsDNA virus sp.]|jgi:lysozyme family protein|nr:MAG: putative glycosyl hydrolase [Prokaryotic dsDNA virus sp.]|tara:strand:- start:17905 stop:18393 length:489 start_codon:yes stop_codon:yes gene_type:complete